MAFSKEMQKYGVVSSSVDTYVRLYKIENGITVISNPPSSKSVSSEQIIKSAVTGKLQYAEVLQ